MSKQKSAIEEKLIWKKGEFVIKDDTGKEVSIELKHQAKTRKRSLQK